MTSLTQSQAAHLARRTGFSASAENVQALMGAASSDAAIELILRQPSSLYTLPDWHGSAPFERTSDQDIRTENKKLRIGWGRELKHWWFNQMLVNTSPIQEKMTLFWANHFTSSLKKVKWPPALLAQNLMLRTHAIGSFRDMLKGILQDPAMLVYLDNASSKKASPNENLARELLELFTMGEGTYSENDVKELSRALTGASINRKTGEYQFKSRQHDGDEKTIFGVTSAFAPDDIADLILEQPEVGPFITEKVWRFFVDDNPSDTDIASLSALFVSADYDLSVLLSGVFSCDAFWAAAGQKIKSPMELLVGSTQLFGLEVLAENKFIRVSKLLGQDLFDPPHVKGWAEGKAWYNTSNLAMREKVTSYTSRKATETPEAIYALAAESVAELPSIDSPDYLNVLLADPAYQVA